MRSGTQCLTKTKSWPEDQRTLSPIFLIVSNLQETDLCWAQSLRTKCGAVRRMKKYSYGKLNSPSPTQGITVETCGLWCIRCGHSNDRLQT